MDESLAGRMQRVEALLHDATPHPPQAEIDHPTETLQQRALDRKANSTERVHAFKTLAERWHGEPPLSGLVLALLDDPDPELVGLAIRQAPAYDMRIMGRLQSLLDDPRPAIWSAAASSLARKKVRAVLPKMMEWSRSGDPDHRREGLAAIAFLLIPEEHLRFVESICELGPIDDRDEQVSTLR